MEHRIDGDVAKSTARLYRRLVSKEEASPTKWPMTAMTRGRRDVGTDMRPFL
jgi:hypothetical protein